MIRQAINCDICGAERLESTSHWFVADEIKGEIRLRGWESPQKSRRNARHLCGQKCVQRMMDNFTAGILKGQHAGKAAQKESAPEAGTAVTDLVDEHGERPLLERMGLDRETIAQVEAESWAGPVKELAPAQESTTAKPRRRTWPERIEEEEESPRKGFINSTRLKPLPLRSAFERMA